MQNSAPPTVSPDSPPATRIIELDYASALPYILIGRSKHRRESLEKIYDSLKKIKSFYIPLPVLNHLGIVPSPLDIHSGETLPTVGPFFMPQTNTPVIAQLCPDAIWDCFLSQKGNFGNGTPGASHFLRRVFMDYQDWGNPDIWHRKVEGAKTENEESDPKSSVQESGSPDDDEDLEKESGSFETSEGNDEEAKNDSEPAFTPGLDQDILIYRTDDWLVYRSQKLFDLEIPDKLRGIDLARSMEVDIPGSRHAWALMDVNLCGDNYPSSAELLALLKWTLRGMYSQNESINSGIGRQDLTDIFPTMVIVLDQRCRTRVLHGYFDGCFKVQFTPILDFEEFTEVTSEDLNEYVAQIDLRKYCGMMHSLLCWAWPCCYCPAPNPSYLRSLQGCRFGIGVPAERPKTEDIWR